MVKFSVGDNNIVNEEGKSGNDADSKDHTHDGNGDPIFDPCAEMMIHDYDDERTLDEEEALETNEDPQTELSDLQKEGDMPLRELLAMYGYAKADDINDSEEEETPPCGEVHTVPLQDDVLQGTPEQEPSKLAQLYSDLSETGQSGGTSRLLRSVSRPQSEEEEDDDCDYSPDEDECKKTIMVGSDYQAKVPVGLCNYDDALPYENDDKILWDPTSVTELETEKFLGKVHDSSQSLTKDDEQALYLLLQCGYNIEEALRRRRINSVPRSEAMSIWSEEECRNFETGMRVYGKDFYTIQKTKVRTRSVGELVQFYYLWKKTERHDVYAHKTRLEKKKYALNPRITDYMDKFLEEQEVGTSSPSSHFGTDGKRAKFDEPPPECSGETKIKALSPPSIATEARELQTELCKT